MVGGLPKESREEMYWDSMDGDELSREPLSMSPENPPNITPWETRGGSVRDSGASPVATTQRYPPRHGPGQRHQSGYESHLTGPVPSCAHHEMELGFVVC